MLCSVGKYSRLNVRGGIEWQLTSSLTIIFLFLLFQSMFFFLSLSSFRSNLCLPHTFTFPPYPYTYLYTWSPTTTTVLIKLITALKQNKKHLTLITKTRNRFLFLLYCLRCVALCIDFCFWLFNDNIIPSPLPSLRRLFHLQLFFPRTEKNFFNK
jgi:hypothetical protein